jgi:hypothetical protein
LSSFFFFSLSLLPSPLSALHAQAGQLPFFFPSSLPFLSSPLSSPLQFFYFLFIQEIKGEKNLLEQKKKKRRRRKKRTYLLARTC